MAESSPPGADHESRVFDEARTPESSGTARGGVSLVDGLVDGVVASRLWWVVGDGDGFVGGR